MSGCWTPRSWDGCIQPWRRLLVGSFIGTATLYVGWYSEYYTLEQRALTVFFTLMFGAIFSAIPLLTPLTKSRWRGDSRYFDTATVINAAALFLALFAMYESERVTLHLYSFGSGGAYLVLSRQFKRRAAGDEDRVKVINLLHIASQLHLLRLPSP